MSLWTNQSPLFFFGMTEDFWTRLICAHRSVQYANLERNPGFSVGMIYKWWNFQSYASLLDDRFNVEPKNYHFWNMFIE
jgi:hypothetical protein